MSVFTGKYYCHTRGDTLIISHWYALVLPQESEIYKTAFIKWRDSDAGVFKHFNQELIKKNYDIKVMMSSWLTACPLLGGQCWTSDMKRLLATWQMRSWCRKRDIPQNCVLNNVGLYNPTHNSHNWQTGYSHVNIRKAGPQFRSSFLDCPPN